MNIKLNWFRITNFKGIKDLLVELNGKNINIFGNNATGKTTTKDAVRWLLFDKDSNNNADTKFTIKPQDELGKDINHLQTVVEAELLVDGKPLMLKKLREEDWVTRRGTTEPVMDGHTKKYWFNEVPCKAREYQAKVDELVNESIFKMITDPAYFNTKIKWEDRRNILIEISGDKTDEQVIASDEGLSRLTEILNGRTIDEYKLVLADKLKGLKKERDDLPPRIDELTMSLPQEEPDYSAVEEELKKHKETLSGIELLLTNSTEKANQLNKKYQELAKMNNQLEEVKAKIKANSGADRKKLIEKKAELENGKYLLESNIQELKHQIEGSKVSVNYGEQELARLREEWQKLYNARSEIMAKEFIEDDITTNCPTCRQPLPEEAIESKLADLKSDFEEKLRVQIEQIDIKLSHNKDTGIATKEKVETAKKNKELAEKELEEKEFKLENLKISINALDEELNKPIPEPDYTKYPEYNELLQKIQELQTELDKPVEDKSAELLQRKSEIQSKIDELNKVLNGKEELEKKKARIAELKVEEKRVSTLIAELEGHKFLLDQFVVAKVNLLEDSINSQFKHVRFKLFEENITNEGIKETCVALVNTNGAYVKYEDANSAGRINAGIDCINALSNFYGVIAPIWIDNRESVVKLADTDSQIISLVVSEADKDLRVEIDGK